MLQIVQKKEITSLTDDQLQHIAHLASSEIEDFQRVGRFSCDAVEIFNIEEDHKVVVDASGSGFEVSFEGIVEGNRGGLPVCNIHKITECLLNWGVWEVVNTKQ